MTLVARDGSGEPCDPCGVPVRGGGDLIGAYRPPSGDAPEPVFPVGVPAPGRA